MNKLSLDSRFQSDSSVTRPICCYIISAVCLLIFLASPTLFMEEYDLRFPTTSVQDEKILWTRNKTSPSASAKKLYNAWETIYHFRSDCSGPSRNISAQIDGKFYPLAPHLQDCFRITEKRSKFNSRNENKSVPDWATPKMGNDSRPPWVEGSDSHTLAGTAFVQTSIWMQQFPEDCTAGSLKFAAIFWPSSSLKNFGYQLHIMSYRLGIALKEGRIAVFFPADYKNGPLKSCSDSNYMSVNCLFFPVTDEKCEKRAVELWTQKSKDLIRKIDDKPRLLDTAFNPNGMDKPWMVDPTAFEVLGQVPNVDEKHRKVSWWHAQAIRFILRYPSNYMCHAMNKVRHQSYGLETAQFVHETFAGQDQATANAASDVPDDVQYLNATGALMSRDDVPSLERDIWWDQVPYLPRPILGLHLARSDNKRHAFSAASYMWLAERLRTHVPDIGNIWLNPETTGLTRSLKDNERWSFLYAPSSTSAASRCGNEEDVFSIARLLISADCDYFIGPLGSSSVRVAHALRRTNGRLQAGTLALDYDEW